MRDGACVLRESECALHLLGFFAKLVQSFDVGKKLNPEVALLLRWKFEIECNQGGLTLYLGVFEYLILWS